MRALQSQGKVRPTREAVVVGEKKCGV